ILPKQRFSRRTVSHAGWGATRGRRGYAKVSGRSVDAGSWSDEGCEAAKSGRSSGNYKDSGVADFLRRCAAVAGGARRASGARGVARWSGDYLPRGAGAGESAFGGEVQLGAAENFVRRDREDSGIDVSGRMGDSREPSRRVGERRGRPGLGTNRHLRRSTRAR